MNGENLRTGGVACVERLRNPIQAARLVLDKSPHVYFVGPGAEDFAAQHGMPLIDNTELVIPRELDRLTKFHALEAAGGSDTTFSGNAEFTSSSPTPTVSSRPERSAVERPASGTATNLQTDPTTNSHDTVGAVALDQYGNLAAATSTGGTLSKAPGRVGDSSLIGCGCYADNLSAAVSLTGWGEPIMKLVLGKWAVDRVASGATPQQAATEAIAYLYQRLGGHGGLILLGPNGQLGIAHNTPRMAWGYIDANGPHLGITRNE
jgi:beta-aspartyl-peptidase (threonine type)